MKNPFKKETKEEIEALVKELSHEDLLVEKDIKAAFSSFKKATSDFRKNAPQPTAA